MLMLQYNITTFSPHVANKASIKDLTHSKFCCLQPPTVPFLLKLQTSRVQHMIVCRYTGVFLEYTDNILNTLVQGINYCFYHMSEKQQKDANIYINCLQRNSERCMMYVWNETMKVSFKNDGWDKRWHGQRPKIWYALFKHLNQQSAFTVKGRVWTRWPKHCLPSTVPLFQCLVAVEQCLGQFNDHWE